MKNINFQNVFESLQQIMPQKWKKVVFRAEYLTGCYEMKYFVDLGNGKYVDCFELDQFSKGQIIKAFMNIDKEISPVRAELQEKDKWSVMTMIIYATGDFETLYDYTDISENSIDYMNKWKNKYLV